MCREELSRSEVDELWRIFRNDTLKLFDECGDNRPDAEEIAIAWDRGHQSPESARSYILQSRQAPYDVSFD